MDENTYYTYVGDIDELVHNMKNNFPIPEPAMRQAIIQLANIFKQFLTDEYYVE